MPAAGEAQRARRRSRRSRAPSMPSSCGRRTSTRCSPVGSSVERWTTTASPAGRGGVDGGRDGRRRVDHDEVARRRSHVARSRAVLGRGSSSPIDTIMRTASRRPSVSSGGSVASSSGGQHEVVEVDGRGGGSRRSCRHHLAGAVAAARLVALDEGEDARARCPRAAGGRRCPRRGRRPGASGCACRRGRWSAPAGRGARRRAPGRRGRAPPWWRRSRPSPRRPRPTRRT